MSMQESLRALADPTRREILNLLKANRLSAGEIASHFDISDAAVSRHLAVLREAELVFDEREGKFIYYSLNASVLEEILLWLTDLKGASRNEASIGEKALDTDFNNGSHSAANTGGSAAMEPAAAKLSHTL